MPSHRPTYIDDLLFGHLVTNLKSSINILFQQNAYEFSIVCKMSAILFRLPSFNNRVLQQIRRDILACNDRYMVLLHGARSSMAKINTILRVDTLCWFRSSHGPFLFLVFMLLFFCHSLQQLFVTGILKRMNPIPVLQSNTTASIDTTVQDMISKKYVASKVLYECWGQIILCCFGAYFAGRCLNTNW